MAKAKANEITMDFDDKIVVIRSVMGKVNMTYFFNPCPDERGVYPPCVKKINSQGDMIMTDAERNSGKYFIPENAVIQVQDGTVFDLNNEVDNARWEAIKNCKLIAPERFAKDKNGDYLIDGTMDYKSRKPRYGQAELYVDRPGLESAQRVSKKKLLHQAIQFILDDERGIEGQLQMARLLGRHMENMPNADVVDFLIQKAEKEPKKIIDLYSGDDLSLRILLCDAVDKKVITVKNKLYIYNGTVVLGATDEAVITWMKDPKNKKTLELIRVDTYPDLEGQH